MKCRVDKARRACPPLGKMSEYRRAFQTGGCYFFTVVTHERRPWLAEEYALDRLRKALRRVMQGRPFAMDAIAVSPDHLHCIWQLPDGDNDFPERLRQIKRFVSIGMNSPLNACRKRHYGNGATGNICSGMKTGSATWITYTTIRSSMVTPGDLRIGHIVRFGKQQLGVGMMHPGVKWNQQVLLEWGSSEG